VRIECTHRYFKFNHKTDTARSFSVILGHFTFFFWGGGSSNINKLRLDHLGVNRFRCSWDEVLKRVFLRFKFWKTRATSVASCWINFDRRNILYLSPEDHAITQGNIHNFLIWSTVLATRAVYKVRPEQYFLFLLSIINSPVLKEPYLFTSYSEY